MPHTSTSEVLKSLNLALERAMTQALTGTSVPYSQAGVLLHLADRAGQPTAQRDLEEHFGISNPAVSGLVKRLAAKGLVTAAPDPDDARRRDVRVTDAGLAAMEDVRRRVATVDTRLLAGLTDDEATTLHDLLARVRANLAASTASTANTANTTD